MNRFWPLVLGLALGLMGGLYYSWVFNPAEYVDTSPASLSPEFKEDYLALLAAAYAASGDLDRAQERLANLPDPDPVHTLSQLAQTRLAQGNPQSEARALARLAAALAPQPSPFPSRTQAPNTSATDAPRATSTATRPPTRIPTRTATATPGAPFELVEREDVCDPTLEDPLLQIIVLDSAGSPIPGVEALIVWDTGQDRFFTGLKPELGLGYADFTMSPGVVYTLQIGSVETTITDVQMETCTSEAEDTFPGSLLLTFQQPEQP